MPCLTDAFYEHTKIQQTNQYIETGAYRGDGIKNVLRKYAQIHSIELSKEWYDYNTKQFCCNPSVHMHHGDSKKILPELLKSINEPVTIYLDAHYSGGTTAFGDEETPLLAELDILKQRPYNDIIVIDDCRLLAKKGSCGCSDDHPIYPTMKYDWSDVTLDGIVSRMKEGFVMYSNEHGTMTDGARDQLILAKPNTNT